MIPGLGFGEMVLIFAVLLLLFGAKRLPELAGGMGKGIRDFKRALNGLDEESMQANRIQQANPAQATIQQPTPPQNEQSTPPQG